MTAEELEENKKWQEEWADKAQKKLDERRRLKKEIQKDFPKYSHEA